MPLLDIGYISVKLEINWGNMSKLESSLKVLKMVTDHSQIGFSDLLTATKLKEEQLLSVINHLVSLNLIKEHRGPLTSLNTYHVAVDGLATLRKHQPCVCKLCEGG